MLLPRILEEYGDTHSHVDDESANILHVTATVYLHIHWKKHYRLTPGYRTDRYLRVKYLLAYNLSPSNRQILLTIQYMVYMYRRYLVLDTHL